MPLYDFKCTGGCMFDRIVPFDTEKVKCDCGKMAKRHYGGPVNLTHRMNTKEGGTRMISKPTPNWAKD